jgi:heptaprenyl diphosphate synthase
VTSLIGVDFADAQLEASVRSGLDSVEDLLRSSVRSDDAFIAEAARYLVDAGGKRFRPLMTVLASHFGDPSASGVVPAAVVVELTHLATLYHDDVMDEARVRRGAPSANARWDNTIAILTGDFLFARASDLLADLGPAAVRLQARTFERLVSGQIRETVGPAEGEDPIGHYLDVLAEKTGSLIATAAEFGARFAGVDDSTVQRLRQFAEHIGVAFQISDDILDVVAAPSESGKTPGTDLREGVATLPVLYALRSPAAPPRLRQLVSHPLVDDDEHAEALALLRSSKALDEARATVQHYADTARTLLAELPDVAARAGFEGLTHRVIDRTG